MDNKTKTVGGISIVSLLLLVFHFWSLIKALNSNEKNNELKNAKATIIFKDSTGKPDTMPLDDYLKIKKK